MVDLDLNAVKERSCVPFIGTAELVGAGCLVDGKLVDYHVAVRFDKGGHLFFECGGANFMGSTNHHGALVDPTVADSTVDAMMFSVLNPDTSCPNAHVAQPFSFGSDGKTIFTSFKISSAIHAYYAQNRHDQLSNRNDIRQVTFDSQQELLTKIKNLPDREISFCVEFPKKFRLVPGLLQRDDELIHHFPEGINTETSFVQGRTVERSTNASYPFAVAGVDMLLGVGGLHHLEKKDNPEDYLKKRMGRLNISGVSGSSSSSLQSRPNASTSGTPASASAASVGRSSGHSTMNAHSSGTPARRSSRRSTMNASTSGTPASASAASVGRSSGRSTMNAHTGGTPAPVSAASVGRSLRRPNASTSTSGTPASAASVGRSSGRSTMNAHTSGTPAPMSALRLGSSSGHSTMNAHTSGTPAPMSAVRFAAPMSNSAATTSAATNPHVSVCTNTNKSDAVPNTNASKSEMRVAASPLKPMNGTEAAKESADRPAPVRTNGEYFSKEGVALKLHKAKADGNCGLLSILERYDDPVKVEELRMSLAQFVMSNREHYQPIINGLGQNFPNTVQNVMTMGQYIGEFEIQVYTDYSGDEVFVFWDGQINRFAPSQDFNSATPTGVARYLFYNGTDHFDYFLPLVEDVDNEMESVNGGNEENINGDEDVEGANNTFEEFDGGEDEGAEDSHGGAEDYFSTPGTNGGTGYSGSYEFENIPLPQPRDASSPNGSPLDRAVEAARSAASSAARSAGEWFFGDGGGGGGGVNVRPQNLNEEFENRSRGGRVRKQAKRFSPSAF